MEESGEAEGRQKGERAAKATESPSDCTYTLARLQIYSTSFFYFSPLFFRSSDLSFYCSPPGLTTAKPRPPTLCSPRNNSSILFLHSLSLSLSPFAQGLTSDRHVTMLVPGPTSPSLTYHRWIHKSFGTEISIQALLLHDALTGCWPYLFDALTSVKSRSSSTILFYLFSSLRYRYLELKLLTISNDLLIPRYPRLFRSPINQR